MNYKGKTALKLSGGVALAFVALGAWYGYTQWRLNTYEAIALDKIQHEALGAKSAALRNVKVYERSPTVVNICGEFNATDQAAGSSGYQRFVVTVNKRFRKDDPPIVMLVTERDPKLRVGVFLQEWAEACHA